MKIDDSPQSPSSPPPPESRRRALGLVGLVVGSLVLCGLALAMGWIEPSTLERAVDPSTTSGVILFIALAVVVELLWLPRMWVLMAAGVLFGVVGGVALSMVGDTISALICYGLARGGGREWAAKKIASRPRADRIVEMFAKERGGLVVAIARVTPVAHYTLVSYLAGLTGVRFWPFLIGNTFGLIPSAVLYAVLGASIFEPGSPTFLVAISILAAAFIATAVLARRAARAKSAEEAEEPGAA